MNGADILDNFQRIVAKLNAFSRKYYKRQLVRGSILFAALGLLMVMGLLSIEYFLWLGRDGRLVLLLMGLIIEGYLFSRFIVLPLFFLFRIRKGLTYKQASLLIGRHFPQIGDKLYNLLDLSDDSSKSELLLASMDQRSRQLSPIPFTNAIDYREAFRALKYLALPFLVVLLVWLSGNISDFFLSYKRVVNYNVAYQPPAPFVFEPVMGDLNVLESETFTVQVRTRGEVRPDEMSINISGREHLMKKDNGVWHYTIEPPLQTTDFYFVANGIRSGIYELTALEVPAIVDFELELVYPSYLNRKKDIIRSTGNAVFPEGTMVTWKINSRNTGDIHLGTQDTSLVFSEDSGTFYFRKQVFRDTEYSIRTSNTNVADHEVLNYAFTVIRDAAPEIRVVESRDTLNPGVAYYSGEASDDYGLAYIALVAYPEGSEGEEDKRQQVSIAGPGGNFERFYYTFPSGIRVEEGTNYEYYFTATDNDALRKGKTSKSQIFRMRVLNKEELHNERLESQEELLKGMNTTFEEFKKEKEEYNAIARTQKEKNQLNYRDQTQLRDFLERQRQQEEMMENFSLELKKNLEDSGSDEKMNKLLQERLERREQDARKNADLLEELKKVSDKINKEELSRRLEEIGKQRQSNERSLQQLLELTKRYYVTEKAAQLARELEKLALKQKALAGNDADPELSEKVQNELNDEFDNQTKELDTLRKDNEDLKKPLSIDISKQDEEVVKSDQQNALEEIRKHQGNEEGNAGKPVDTDKNKIRQKQQNAGDKIQEMSEKLQQSSSSSASGDSGIAEDARMLRQILDNLVTFSFKQEQLFEKMEKEGDELGNYTSQVREQQKLRELFGHIDDSLFALSLRRAEISELVNEQITEVYYNIDKALESVSESRIYQGISHQQYVFTAANTLAEFLAGLLDNMQQSLAMGSGQGSSEGFQLPDIIKSQGQLGQKMVQKGKGETQGEQDGQDGEKGQDSQGEGEGGEGKSEGRGERNGEGNGTSGEGEQQREGNGAGSEAEMKELYEIYKQQQLIREALELQLQDMIEEKDRQLAARILRQMESFENELLNQGITERTISLVNKIEYELLKMENAALKQGKRKERESNSNERQYQAPILTKPRALEDYNDEIEILTRQALPLHQIFQNRVKKYFEKDDRLLLSN